MEPDRTLTHVDNGIPGGCTCFECDSLAGTEWRRHTFAYGVGSSAVELTVSLPVRVCRSCGFEFLDHEAESLKHDAVCEYLGVLTPREIRRIRESHEMSRAAFARVSRLGEATLNRWENGILIQNQANDRYLRLLRLRDNIQRLEESDSGNHIPSTTSELRFPTLYGMDGLQQSLEQKLCFRLH